MFVPLSRRTTTTAMKKNPNITTAELRTRLVRYMEIREAAVRSMNETLKAAWQEFAEGLPRPEAIMLAAESLYDNVAAVREARAAY